MQVCCFVGNPPTPLQSGLVKRMEQLATPLVDSVHKDRDWFIKNFSTINHRVYYVQPILLYGKIEDVDFGISGMPDMICYGPCEDWTDLDAYFDWQLFGNHDNREAAERGMKILHPVEQFKPYVEPAPIIDDDPFVVHRKAEEHLYKYEHKHIPEIDVQIFSVYKPFVEDPFTVIISTFSERDPSWFFSSLFSCKDWGEDFNDRRFLESLWVHLGLPEPYDIDEIMKKHTALCYPSEGGVAPLVEPTVFRKSIEDLLKGQDFGIKLSS